MPLGPNVFAVCVCFAFLMAAPWICLELQAKFWEDAIGADPVANMFLATSVEESFVIAVVGSLLFLVIGVILQAWQSSPPVPLPLALDLRLADRLGPARPRRPVRAGARCSPASSSARWSPLAFGIYWVTLVYLRETMD